ncbi:MAG: pyridoxine 5'-phosphate synthase [Flavobacteriales bacterium]
MTKLSVNINKIATIRNARGGNIPNVVQVAIDAERFGADGITVHPRPDERHITRKDLQDLSPIITTEFNIEGYPSEDFVETVLRIKPHQATLVPDPPNVVTSNAGWNTITHQDFLKNVISRFKTAGIRTSIFIETNCAHIEAAATIGTDRVELYTEAYAARYSKDRDAAIAPYVIAAKVAKSVGLGLNAGHDLSLENLRFFKQSIPNLLEVSIGHALISDALYYGLENTIMMYKRELR